MNLTAEIMVENILDEIVMLQQRKTVKIFTPGSKK